MIKEITSVGKQSKPRSPLNSDMEPRKSWTHFLYQASVKLTVKSEHFGHKVTTSTGDNKRSMYFWERCVGRYVLGKRERDTRDSGQSILRFLEDLIHLFTHSFIQYIMESLLCVRQCLGTRNTKKQKKKILPSWSSSSSGWEAQNKQ